jgi:hypothetical protein
VEAHVGRITLTPKKEHPKPTYSTLVMKEVVPERLLLDQRSTTVNSNSALD